jgi:hypothetical protein
MDQSEALFNTSQLVRIQFELCNEFTNFVMGHSRKHPYLPPWRKLEVNPPPYPLRKSQYTYYYQKQIVFPFGGQKFPP